MFAEEKKGLLDQYGISYWSGYETEDLLLAIMAKLLEIEKRLDAEGPNDLR